MYPKLNTAVCMENTLRCNWTGTLGLWTEGCNSIGDSVHAVTSHEHPCPTAGNLLSKGETEQTVPKVSWPADQMMTSRPFKANLARIRPRFLSKLLLEERWVIKEFTGKPASPAPWLFHLQDHLLGAVWSWCPPLIFTKSSGVLKVIKSNRYL